MSNRCSCTMLTELCLTGAGGRNTLSGLSLNTVAYMNEQGHPMSKLVGTLNIRNPKQVLRLSLPWSCTEPSWICS